MDRTVILPSTHDPEGFVDLGARSTKGKLFRKQILHMGQSFVHPNMPSQSIKVDHELAMSLKRNFDSKMCDIVQVPIVDGKNSHTEDPLRNIGEVVDIDVDDDGVYAIIDARKPEYADQLGKTLIGASALMHMNYGDTKTGTKVGPTLLHVAVTNRPYITDLRDFEEIIAASADTFGSELDVMSPTDQQESPMELDEMLEVLRDQHGIDVLALQEASTGPTSEALTAALSNVLADAGVIQPAGDDQPLDIKDVADAVIELAEEKVALSGQVADLVREANAAKHTAATAEVESLVKEGRVLPKQRETMIALSMNDRDTFEALLPDTAIVSLSENGVLTHDAPPNDTLQADIDRFAALAEAARTGKK